MAVSDGISGGSFVTLFIGDSARAQTLLQDALDLADRIGLPEESRQLAGETGRLAGSAD